MKEITQRGDIILFIDELHNLVGAGAAEGAIDAASILKPALARGELQTIGATTLDEYRKYLERDAALERRFQQIRVEEPSVDDTVADPARPARPLRGAPPLQDLRRGAARRGALADRYIQDRHLPDKAIDLDRRGRVAHADQEHDRAAALPRARGGDRRRSAARRKTRSSPRSSRRPRRCATRSAS
jgi:ATP-dependent Clp protease ATP-binding subunit ClpC